MMNIVIDTSIVIAVITNEKNKKKIIELTTGANLFAPASLHWEIGNAFSAMFKRNKLNLKQAKIALRYYSEIPIRFSDIELENVLDIAIKYNIYAYDAYFVIAAKELNTPLLSLDKNLIEVARSEGLKVIEV
jgi:predicted nucleic acid-binding protein